MGICCMTQGTQTVALWQSRRVGWGGEVGRRFGREGTCVYLWLILVDVWQKTTKYCKAIIFQFKKKRVHLLKKIPYLTMNSKHYKNQFSSLHIKLEKEVYANSNCSSWIWITSHQNNLRSKLLQAYIKFRIKNVLALERDVKYGISI